MKAMPRTEIGDIMRDVLREYHEYVSLPHWGPAYVTHMQYSRYPTFGFIITPFDKRRGVQHIARRSWDDKFWEFSEIPF
jgi:hypothetical protein